MHWVCWHLKYGGQGSSWLKRSHLNRDLKEMREGAVRISEERLLQAEEQYTKCSWTWQEHPDMFKEPWKDQCIQSTVGQREKLGGETRTLIGPIMKGLIGHCDFGFSLSEMWRHFRVLSRVVTWSDLHIHIIVLIIVWKYSKVKQGQKQGGQETIVSFGPKRMIYLGWCW